MDKINMDKCLEVVIGEKSPVKQLLKREEKWDLTPRLKQSEHSGRKQML